MRKDLHVVFIGLDGWGGYDLEKSLTHMPNVRKYSQIGLFSDNKMAVNPTKSAPNWASMFMGVNPEIHGFISNSKIPSNIYNFELKNNIIPTISQVIKSEDSSSEIGLFYQWSGVFYVVDDKSVNYICRIPPLCNLSHRILTNRATRYIKKSKPTFCTIIYDDPDHTGHKYGYYSEEYYSVLERLDEYIERIVTAYKEAGIYNNTVFIITSDHGGNGKTHGNDSLKEKMTPLFMWGKGVKKTGYVSDEIEQQDVAVIMAALFNLQIPNQWTGKINMNYIIKM